MRLLLRAYPRPWRKRYGDELLALLEAEPLGWRDAADVVAAGLRERLFGSGPAQLVVLRAWSLFVVGGIGFQKASEHWQAVVPAADRAVPAAAFDAVVVAAAIGSAAVLAGVAVALPAFVRDLRDGGWAVVRGAVLGAAAASAVALAALGALALHRDVAAAAVFVAFALASLCAWTHAAVVAAQRLTPHRLHARLAALAAASMAATTVAAAVWLASVLQHAPSFVGAAQLAVIATCMLLGTSVGLGGVSRTSRRSL